MHQKNFRRHIVIALSIRLSVPLRVRCISTKFFEVGIPNLVCGCILGSQIVVYHFRVSVALILTSDLVFRIALQRVKYTISTSSIFKKNNKYT